MAEGTEQVSVRLEDAGRIRDGLGALLGKGVLGRHDAPKAEVLRTLFARRCDVPMESVLAAVWPEDEESKAQSNYRGFKKRLNEHFEAQGLRLVMCNPQDNSPAAQKRVWFEEVLTPEELARRAEDEEARKATEVIEREHRREFPGTPSAEYVAQEVTIGLPAVRFPDTLTRFAERFAPDEWTALAPEDRTFLSNLCTKLEPIVQIVPQTPVPMVLGFECLALGMNGQAFGEIEKRFEGKVSPALLRFLITLAAFESASTLRSETRLAPNASPQQLLFTINLDPPLLESDVLERFLDTYRDKWQTNVLFEISESTAKGHVPLIKQLVEGFGLRLCFDDVNELQREVRYELSAHAELSKVDFALFQELMKYREKDAEAVVRDIASYSLAGKPLLVEGVESESYLHFLRRHWTAEQHGTLLGQGHILTPGSPWDGWTADLRSFGLRGGHILASPVLAEASRIVRDFVPTEHRPRIRSENRGRVFLISIPGKCFGRDKDLVVGIFDEQGKGSPMAGEKVRDLDLLVVKNRLGTLGWEQVTPVGLRSHLDAWARAGQVSERVLHDRRERLYQPDHYVSPQVTPLKGSEVSSAEEGRLYLLDWVRMPDVRFCAILGDYGVGKSFLSRMWSAMLLELRERGERSLPVPLYLDMRNLPVWREERVPRLEEMLDHLLKEAGFGELPSGGVLAAVRRGHVVLIFDGFDEHSVHLTDAQATELMRQIRSAAPADSQGKVLVTCRTHYFLDRANELEKLQGGGGGVRTREGFEAGDFSIAYLQPFDEARIRAYLRKVLGHEADEAFEFMGRIHDLVDLGKRPVLLAMIASHLDHLERRANSGERVKAADIYEGVLHDWLERDTGKHVLFPDLKSDLMAELARRLWIAGGHDATVFFSDLRSWVLGRIRDTFRFENPEAVWRVDADMRTATFLVRGAVGDYRFAHTSFLEFFLARGVSVALSEGRPEALDLPRLNKEVVEFTVDLIHSERGDPSCARKVVSAVLEGAYCRQRSENAVLLLVTWQRLRPESAPQPAALHLEGADLDGAHLARGKLSGARLPAANLERVVLDEAKLPGADLRGANLREASARSVDLSGACLAESRLDFADLAGSSLQDCDASKATGRGVFLQRTDCRGACFEQAQLSYARLARATVQDAQLSQGDFRNASSPVVALPLLALVPHLGHGAGVLSVAFSPDGAIMASAGYDNCVKLWEAPTGRLLRTLEAHGGVVTTVAFGPDGAAVASGSFDGSICVWEVLTGRLLRTLRGDYGSVWNLAFAPDGVTIASGTSNGSIDLWGASTGCLLRSIECHRDVVSSVALSPDGLTMASGSYDGSVGLWDTATGRLVATFDGHSLAVSSVAFSMDGATIASGSSDRHVKLWDATSARLLRTLEGHHDWVTSVCFRPGGAMIASAGYDRCVRLWDTASGRLVQTLEGHEEWIRVVAFSPDGATIASGSDDNTVKFWDVATGRLVRTLAGHGGAVADVAFRPDGEGLVSMGLSNEVLVWDVGGGALLPGGVKVVPCFGKTARSRGLIATTWPEGTIRISRERNAALLATLAAWSPDEWVVWTPDGYFNAPKAAWHRIGVTDGLVSYPVEEFAEHFHRPDIIRERLRKAREG